MYEIAKLWTNTYDSIVTWSSIEIQYDQKIRRLIFSTYSDVNH